MRHTLLLILLLALPISYAQTLLIGTTSQNPPFSSLADQKDHFYGFDIDIMGEICKRIKLSCTFTPSIFNELFTKLQTGKIDIAIAAIVITKDRQQQFLFSLPYLESYAQFITKSNSSINTPKDIQNKKVGVRRGTPFKNLALELYNNQINIIEFPGVWDLLEGLNNNTIDIALTNAEAAKYWFTNNDDLYKLIGNQIETGEGYGIMANKGQEKLIAQINHALMSMQADGTYLEIYTRYFGK